MNGYVCFYNRQRVEVHADTPYAAKMKAAEQLRVKPKQQHMIAVVLAERSDGSTVTHSTAEL